MRKIEITISEEQYEKLSKEIKCRTEINIQEETFSGFSFELSVIEAGISWLDLKMGSVIELGEVAWDIKSIS